MKVLGIETSCDETALAFVVGLKKGLQVEKSVVLSQIQTHQKYGGVVPEVAAREHVKAITAMLHRELPDDGSDIDVIAVTAGPGLAPALRVGVETAKTLAYLWQKPLLPINHLEGHILANWIVGSPPFQGGVTGLRQGFGPALRSFSKERRGGSGRVVSSEPPPAPPLKGGGPPLPALALLVSGGHTELILMKDFGEYQRLGETLDDAAGEAFDKVAKMLGLEYPGGPAIAKLAKGGDPHKYDFPRGLLDRPNLDFSFSGLKTSVLYFLRQHEDEMRDEQFLRDVAASFQEAVVDVLVRKTMRAVKKYAPQSVLLAGGVAANVELRNRLRERVEEAELDFYTPEFEHTMDNAAMIAAAGYFKAQDDRNFIDPLTLKQDPNLDFV